MPKENRPRPRTLRERCIGVFGQLPEVVWKHRLGALTGRDYATVKRWASGDLETPAYVDVILDLLEALPKTYVPARIEAIIKGEP